MITSEIEVFDCVDFKRFSACEFNNIEVIVQELNKMQTMACVWLIQSTLR